MSGSSLSHINSACDELAALSDLLRLLHMAAAELPDDTRAAIRVACDQAQELVFSACESIGQAREEMA